MTLANTRDLRLDQIATVRDTSAERRAGGDMDGKPVVGFRIYRALGSDETNVAKLANEALQTLKTPPRPRDHAYQQYRRLYAGAVSRIDAHAV